MSNYIHYKVWCENTFPFILLGMLLIVYADWACQLSILGLKFNLWTPEDCLLSTRLEAIDMRTGVPGAGITDKDKRLHLIDAIRYSLLNICNSRYITNCDFRSWVLDPVINMPANVP